MECPCCGSPLEYRDTYGRLAAHQDGQVLGYIYRCPIAEEGFLSEEDALKYVAENSDAAEDNWEDVRCLSALHHVSGSWYSDLQENLHAGYPC